MTNGTNEPLPARVSEYVIENRDARWYSANVTSTNPAASKCYVDDRLFYTGFAVDRVGSAWLLAVELKQD
ncbi:hypothetical protein [Halococcus sp. PRR34]|uniref:hypothetical protein n=1 Tax=Halococcus sp. PRR34 TaxID=3020830 RepID=UPI0023615E98|nr:hypothetical protein [Halococcus sp. PRR34]